MAKKSRKDGVNKSEEIRKYMVDNPTAGPQAVSDAMKTLHNIEVKPQFVSTVKSNDKRKGKKKPGKRGRKPGVSAAAGVATSGGGISLESLRAVKAFIDKMGGLKKAKAAVDLLAELTD